MVAHEEYLAMQVQETVHHVLDIAMVLVSSAVLRVEEELLHLALGVEMLREEIDVSVVCEPVNAKVVEENIFSNR